jgi:hypothetical protein
MVSYGIFVVVGSVDIDSCNYLFVEISTVFSTVSWDDFVDVSSSRGWWSAGQVSAYGTVVFNCQWNRI